jgi:hypothetical protein
MNYLEWKNQLYKNFLEISNQDTVYSHVKSINENEIPNLFFSIPEKKIDLTQLSVLLDQNIKKVLPKNSKFTEEILKKISSNISYAKKEIRCLSSFFLSLETSWTDVNPSSQKNSFYSHFHPPRSDADHLYTLTYITPIKIFEPITESFNYVNLLNHGEFGIPYTRFKNTDKMLSEFSRLRKKFQNFDWTKLIFSSSETIQIKFDSCNVFHNLTGITTNLFLVIVINDVEFLNPISRGSTEIKYLPDI